MALTDTRGDEPTIGRLVADASRDVSTLVRSEIALAKSELKVSVRAGGVGAALLVVAGFIALLSLILLSIAFAYLLSNWMHPAWAFLIVIAAASVSGLLVRRRLDHLDLVAVLKTRE